MAAKPFKFRHVNEIAGFFALAIVLVLIVAVLFVGHAQRWFETVKHLTIILPENGSMGLKNGSEVQMLGTNIGTVDRIDIDPNTAKMKALVHVQPGFAKFITTSSRIVIHVPVALGDTTLQVTRGSGAAADATTALVAVPETDASQSISQTLEDIRTKTVPAVQNLIEQYTQLAVELRDPNGPVKQSLQHFNRVAAQLESNDSLIGRLINDKSLADSLTSSLSKLSTSMDDVQAMLKNLRSTTDELPKIAKSASAQIDQLPPMIEQTRLTIVEVRKTLQDLQKTTSQLPGILTSVRQTTEQLPHIMSSTQQTLLEVQKLIKAMQQLPLIRDGIEPAGGAGRAPRPVSVGGAP